MVTINTTFNGNTLELDVLISEQYSDPDNHLDTGGFKYYLYEYRPGSSPSINSDPYELIYTDEPNVQDFSDNSLEEIDGGQTIQMAYRKWRFFNPGNRLIKWVVKIPKFLYNANGVANGYQLDMCCANIEGDYFVFEGYCVDLQQYEKDILDSINLQCNDCEVPRDLLTKLLRLFAVKTAADSGSEYLEMIYSKLVCNQRYNMVVTTHASTHNCGCNG